MKKSFILLFAACIAWPAAAQQFEFNAIKSQLLQVKGVRTLSETANAGQEKDHVANQHLETQLSLPYKSKSEKKTVEAAIAQLKAAYDSRLSSATKAVAHIQAIEETDIEGPAVTIGYVKTPGTIALGGKGHSYALVRQTDSGKPQISTYDGAQWWLDKTGKRVVFQLLHISGPHQESGTQTRVITGDHSLDSLRGLSQEELFERLGIKPEDIKTGTTLNREMLNLKILRRDLEALSSIHKKLGSAYASSIVKLRNDRVQQALNYLPADTEYKMALFSTLAKNGRYKAEIISGGKQIKTETVDIMELVRRWPSLKVFCMSFEEADTPVAKKYEDCDGVIQVYLDD